MKINLFTALIATAIALTVPVQSFAQDEDSAKITPNNAAYIYDAYAAKPLGVAAIAGTCPRTFERAPDEFAQWDYLQKLLPSIQRKIKEAKDAGTFILRDQRQLGTI